MQKGEKKPLRAIIYTRVSSKEQVEGTSLGTQKEGCINYCQREGLELDKIFVEEGESAKVIDRTKLKELLEYCHNNKGKITHLVVYKFDRFARNQADHLWLRKELANMGITVKSVMEPIDDTLAGKLQEGILAVINEYDNEQRKERCIKGMQEKMKTGIWCRKPPIGYKIPKKLGAKEKKMLPDIPDHPKFDLIQEGWKMLLTGKFTKAEIVRRLNDKGENREGWTKLYPQKIDSIFKNKFYCGILLDPWTQEEYRGLHKPMITEQEFFLAQEILNGKSRAFISKKLLNPDFPLRGFIRCGSCSNYYTGSWSKGRNKKHPYYHCYRNMCDKFGKSIRKEDLEKYFMGHLIKITPKREFLNKFEKAVMKVWNGKYKQVNEEYLKVENRLEKLRIYKNNLIKKNADGILPDDDFQETLKRTRQEIEILELAANDSKLDMFELEATIAYSKNFVADLPRQWFDLGIEGKKRFQKLLFPEGLPYLGNGKFGTAKMSVIFEINQQLQKEKTNLVGPVGFEPTTKRL